MATISQAREIVAKNPDNYKRFETYETRRQDKKAWGEVLEQFLRTRGSAAPRPLASATHASPLAPPRECPGVFLWAQAALAVAVQRQVSAPHAFAARRGHDLEPGRGGQGAGSLRAVPRGVQTGRRRGGRQEQALEAGVLPPVPARSAAAATAITLSPLPASRCRAPACPAKGDRASCARAPAKRLPAQEALLVTASAPRPRAMLRGR